MQTWRQVKRRISRLVAGTIFLGLLLGAGGTVFTVFAQAVSHLGQSTLSSQTSVVVQPTDASNGSSAQSETAPVTEVPSSSTAGGELPSTIMEYPNTPESGATSQSASMYSGRHSINDEDGINSALGSAMDTGGVYIGEHVQSVFGSMLKGVLNALFINTN